MLVVVVTVVFIKAPVLNTFLEKEREKQLKFEKEKLEMKLKYEEKSAELRKEKQGESSGSHAKLPKLSTMGHMNNGYHFGINSGRKSSPRI